MKHICSRHKGKKENFQTTTDEHEDRERETDRQRERQIKLTRDKRQLQFTNACKIINY